MEANQLFSSVCLLPWATASSLAEAVYQSLAARGYAHIDPKELFIEGFVQQLRRVSQEVAWLEKKPLCEGGFQPHQLEWGHYYNDWRNVWMYL